MKNKKILFFTGCVVVLAGFFFFKKVVPVSAMSTVTIPVKGMSCESCQKNIEMDVSKLPGVSQVSVDLEKETATVTYDKDRIVIQAIVETIAKLGFDAKVPTEQALQVIDMKITVHPEG